MTRDLPYVVALPGHRGLRPLLAAALRAGSRGLDRLALRLALSHAAPADEPWLEFHAEAGAPEGALYVNGSLVGTVTGVNRL